MPCVDNRFAMDEGMYAMALQKGLDLHVGLTEGDIAKYLTDTDQPNLLAEIIAKPNGLQTVIDVAIDNIRGKLEETLGKGVPEAMQAAIDDVIAGKVQTAKPTITGGLEVVK